MGLRYVKYRVEDLFVEFMDFAGNRVHLTSCLFLYDGSVLSHVWSAPLGLSLFRIECPKWRDVRTAKIVKVEGQGSEVGYRLDHGDEEFHVLGDVLSSFDRLMIDIFFQRWPI